MRAEPPTSGEPFAIEQITLVVHQLAVQIDACVTEDRIDVAGRLDTAADGVVGPDADVDMIRFAQVLQVGRTFSGLRIQSDAKLGTL